jgi:hypothetical protein
MGRAAARPFSCAAGYGLQIYDMFRVEHWLLCTYSYIRMLVIN